MAKGSMFFTTILDPKDFRRTLLEASKEMITVLKDYHVLLEMRKEKAEVIEDLRVQFGQLNALLERLDKFVPDDAVKKLQEMLPKPKKEIISPKKKKTSKKKKSSKKNPEEKKEDSAIAKLESALSQIEQKLETV